MAVTLHTIYITASSQKLKSQFESTFENTPLFKHLLSFIDFYELAHLTGVSRSTRMIVGSHQKEELHRLIPETVANLLPGKKAQLEQLPIQLICSQNRPGTFSRRNLNIAGYLDPKILKANIVIGLEKVKGEGRALPFLAYKVDLFREARWSRMSNLSENTCVQIFTPPLHSARGASGYDIWASYGPIHNYQFGPFMRDDGTLTPARRLLDGRVIDGALSSSQSHCLCLPDLFFRSTFRMRLTQPQG